MRGDSLDLFGCHPKAPLSRFDSAGLALILNGRRILDMDGEAVRIEASASPLIFRRRSRTPRETVPLWAIGEEAADGQG